MLRTQRWLPILLQLSVTVSTSWTHVHTCRGVRASLRHRRHGDENECNKAETTEFHQGGEETGQTDKPRIINSSRENRIGVVRSGTVWRLMQRKIYFVYHEKKSEVTGRVSKVTCVLRRASIVVAVTRTAIVACARLLPFKRGLITRAAGLAAPHAALMRRCFVPWRRGSCCDMQARRLRYLERARSSPSPTRRACPA